jgi:hypothetical protein
MNSAPKNGSEFSSEMEQSEMLLLEDLLARRKPEVAIEIGTAGGASLAVLAGHVGVVHSIDIDPQVKQRLGARFANVEFHTGSSRDILPKLIERLQRDAASLGFVLIDGDHSTDGVPADIDAILSYQPITELELLMHDSFHPACREGIRSAGWEECSFVYEVELDFHPGVLHDRADIRGQMWGGFARAVLRPQQRTAPLVCAASEEQRFLTTLAVSAHNHGARHSFLSRIFRSLRG